MDAKWGMGWKDLSYIRKGIAIGIVGYIFLQFITFAFCYSELHTIGLICKGMFMVSSIPEYVIMPFEAILESIGVPLFLVGIILYIITGALIGGLIGLIIGKIKTKF